MTHHVQAVPSSAIALLTKQQFVYAKLRHAIVTCELQPDERLRIDEIARRYGVSIIPVREALHVLQSEGLVVNVPHVGTAVAPIEADSIVEALTILEGLESVSTRIAAERARERDLDDLADQVAAMDRALSGGRTEQWATLNREFHLTIARIASMPLLRDMLTRAFDRWERVWHHDFQGLARRVSQAQAEHHEMVRLMRARSFAALEDTVRTHNRAAVAAYTAQYAARQTAERRRRRKPS
jgi:DNA-binding GntR family transcriptional regulator